MLCELRVLARLVVRTMYDRNAIRFAILPKPKCAIEDLKRDREVHSKRVCFLFLEGNSEMKATRTLLTPSKSPNRNFQSGASCTNM